MPSEKTTKSEIKKLIEIPGEVRGQVFLTDIGYAREKKGEKGVKLLKKKIAEWGNLIDYEKAEALKWYPVGLRAVSILTMKEVFDWGDKEIFELGNAAPKYSFIVKMLMKYFLSVQKTFKEGSRYWTKHYTVGKLETIEYNKKEKYFILRLKDFKIHPCLCPFYAGYFMRIGQYVQRSEKMTIEETKCMFKGDPYHEYVIRWE